MRDAAAPWADQVLMTAEDLMALSDDAWNYELVRGRLVRMPPTGLEHGALGLRLGAALLAFVDERQLGVVTGAETGFLVSRVDEPDTVLAPDAVFIAASKLPGPDSPEWKHFPRLAPDLVVEVSSPSQSRPEMAVKAKLWLSAGVRLVWIILPGTRQVDVWGAIPTNQMKTLDESDILNGEDVLPAFAFPLSRLWR